MDQRSRFASLCAVGFFARFSYALARSPVLPLFALYLGAGPGQIGLIVGVSTVTGIFFKLPAGALSDVIGRGRTMLFGLAVFAVMPFAYLWVRDYHTLIAIRFLHGFATAIYGPVSMAVVMDAAGARKGEMISLFSSVTIIGTLVGAPTGGFILHGASGSPDPSLGSFQTAYIVSGVLGLMALVLGLVSVTRHNAPSAPGARSAGAAFRGLAEGIREVGRDRRVIMISSVEGLQNMTVGALEAFLPIYAVTVAGLTEAEAGMLWGIQVLVTVLSKPVMGRVSDRRGRKPLIVAGMALCALAFGCIPFARGFYTLVTLSAAFGLGEAFVTSSSAAMVAGICRERNFGAAMGAFGTIFDIGHAAGPIAAGLMIIKVGYAGSFLILAGTLMAAVPVFIKLVNESDKAV